MLILSSETPVAKGGEKLIFWHPQDKSKLIKVINPDYITFMKKNRALTYKYRRLKNYWFFRNAITEHLASREYDMEGKHFLQNICGFTDTDLGFGLVVDAVLNENQELALTLKDLIQNNNYQEKHEAGVHDFIQWMTHHHIIIRDLWLDNLVWDEKGSHFVLVDGIGSRYLPSLRSYCKSYNLRGNKKRAVKLLSRIEKYRRKSNL